VIWPLIAAGGIGLAGAAFHGIVGDRIVRRRPTQQGVVAGATMDGRFLVRVSWHLVTIAFAVVGTALVLAGARPGWSGSTGVTVLAGALFSGWAAFMLAASYHRGGLRGWLAHPAPIAFAVSSALAWWGVTLI
jgi:hypothetical protein